MKNARTVSSTEQWLASISHSLKNEGLVRRSRRVIHWRISGFLPHRNSLAQATWSMANIENIREQHRDPPLVDRIPYRRIEIVLVGFGGSSKNTIVTRVTA